MSSGATTYFTQSEGEVDQSFDRPVFIVSPPRSGSTLLFETLLKAPDLYSIGSESHQLIETVPGLSIADQGYESNRLIADNATTEVIAELRARFHGRARDRLGRPPLAGSVFRLLEKTPKNSLRVPFISKVFPQAHFVFLYREPRQVLASMIEAWKSGRFRTYAPLRGWPHPYWSLLLTPGWRELTKSNLPEIVAVQWRVTCEILLNDLMELPSKRIISLRHEEFVANPASVIETLCNFLDLEWDAPIENELPLSRHTLTRPDPDKWRRHEDAINALLPSLQPTIARVTSFVDRHAM